MSEASGLYAAIDLGGARPDSGTAAALGLPHGALARGVDEMLPQCVDVAQSPDRLCIFVGRIDDDGDVGASLGLCRNAAAATIASAALDRYGDDLAAHLPGEWTCLHWDSADRRLRLASSTMQRDPIFFNIKSRQIAIAPNLATFRRLGASLDTDNLLLAYARPPLRLALGDRTILTGVRVVRPGTVVTIADTGLRVGDRPSLVPLDWPGDFDSALLEIEQLMRARLRRSMAGHEHIACLISGGLDSSIIAWLAAMERHPGQTLTLLSSISSPGNGTPDESAFARIVADHLDLPIHWVTPPADAPVYRQNVAAMQRANGPLAGPRHYLYEALGRAALAEGATLLLDGVGGEMSVSGDYPVESTRVRLRRMLRTFARGNKLSGRSNAPQAQFGPRMAAHRLARSPEVPRHSALRFAPTTDKWGFAPGTDKLMRMTTELVEGRLRTDYPFRDTALLCSFAGFPAAFTRHAGLDRSFARMMLVGHLPDSIRLRPKGGGFSPDYDDRLCRQAEVHRSRIPFLRRAGIDDWFDLDWLDENLRRIASSGTTAVADPMQVQITALAAEYLYWCAEPNGDHVHD